MRALALLALLTLPLAAGAQPVPVPDAGPPPALELARADFEHRLDPARLDAAIARLDPLEGGPAELLGARAHLFRARAFRLRKRPLDKQGGLADLEQARAKALLAWVAVQPGASVAQGELSLALASAPPEAAPALTYRAWADVELARYRDGAAGAALLREALACAARAAELDPTVELGAPHRLAALALASLPGPAGGDFARARFEFERAIATAPEGIDNRVEFAARWAVKAQDARLFRALLRSALRQDPAEPAASEPEQRLARTRALALARRHRPLFGR